MESAEFLLSVRMELRIENKLNYGKTKKNIFSESVTLELYMLYLGQELCLNSYLSYMSSIKICVHGKDS